MGRYRSLIESFIILCFVSLISSWNKALYSKVKRKTITNILTTFTFICIRVVCSKLFIFTFVHPQGQSSTYRDTCWDMFGLTWSLEKKMEYCGYSGGSNEVSSPTSLVLFGSTKRWIHKQVFYRRYTRWVKTRRPLIWATKAKRKMIKCVFRISPDLDYRPTVICTCATTGPSAGGWPEISLSKNSYMNY